MASGSVTGTGKLIDYSTEAGSYEYTINTVDNDGSDPTNTSKIISMVVTVSYTDVRETRKWYNLQKSAIDDYITANPSVSVQANLSNEFIEDTYEMITTDVTRTITNVSVIAAPEA